MVLITYTPIHHGTPYMVSNRVAHDVATIWSQYQSAIPPTRDHIWCQIYHIISNNIYETIMVLITYTPIHHGTPYMVSNRVAHDVANIWSQSRSVIPPTRDHIWCQIYHIISTIMCETIMVLITYTPHPVCYHIWS